MNFRPLHDRICIEPIEQEETSAGGIIIPHTASEKPTPGMFLAVGPGS
jgi:chaperonin GroES